ncbi:MAG: signal peptidase I [Cellulomonas sp.]
MQDETGERVPRRRRFALLNALLLVVALGVAYLVWPASLGGCVTLTIVAGGSMEPTYQNGDLVVARCGEPAVGDVIVYQPGDNAGTRVIHRIVGGSDAVGWQMRGDNNQVVDPWRPSGSEVLGVADARVPGVGRLAMLLLSPILWISLIVFAAGMLLWPSANRRSTSSDSSDSNDSSTHPIG